MTFKPVIKPMDGGWKIYLPVPPRPTPRPKVSRWGTYYPKAYQDYVKKLEEALAELSVEEGPWTYDNVHVTVHCVNEQPKNGVLRSPRGDIDNFLKGVLDCITKSGMIYEDDKQITSLWGTKRYALPGEKPHIWVGVWDSMGAAWLDQDKGVTDDVYDMHPSYRQSLSEE